MLGRWLSAVVPWAFFWRFTELSNSKRSVSLSPDLPWHKALSWYTYTHRVTHVKKES